jgi:hypothetical protein
MVLLVGGVTILGSGLVTMWSVRRSLIALGQIGERPEVDTALEAMRHHRKRIAGLEETHEVDVVRLDPKGGGE